MHINTFCFGRDLYEWEDVREEAIATYKNNASQMMYVSAYTVGKDLNLSPEE